MAKSTSDANARVRSLEARVAELEAVVDKLECILQTAARALTSDEFPPAGETFWRGRPTEPNLHRLDTILFTAAEAIRDGNITANVRCPPWCKSPTT